MTKRTNPVLVLAVLMILALFFGAGYVLAQGPQPELQPDEASQLEVPPAPEGLSASDITYQGRLLENGGPANGSYTMIFRLFDAATGGNELWSDTQTVTVNDGLFNVVLQVVQSQFNGRGMWLQLEIGGEVLDPRQQVLPAPYALSVLPWAAIGGNDAGPGALHVDDQDGEIMFALTANNGVLEIGGLGEDGDIYVRDSSDALSFSVDGDTGTIESAATSSMWVSAAHIAEVNGDVQLVRTAGGPVWIVPNAAGDANVEMPADIPLVLYGQPVQVSLVELCYQVMGTGNYIDRFRVYKIDNTGTVTTTVDNQLPLAGDDYTCFPHIPEQDKQFMAADEAGLTVKLDMHFDGSGSANRVVFYGVRIRLGHQD